MSEPPLSSCCVNVKMTTARFFNHTRTAYINGTGQSAHILNAHGIFLSSLPRCYYKHDFSVNHMRTTYAHNNLYARSVQPHCCLQLKYLLDGLVRLGPRVQKIKNGYPESSKDCYSINLKKYIWCIRNHCIASFSELHNATRANKVW